MALDKSYGIALGWPAGPGQSPLFTRPPSDLPVGKLAVRPPTSNAAGLQTFDTWYGANADFATVFNSFTNWTSYLSSIDQVVTNFAGDTRPKVWTIGLNVVGTTLSQAATGTFTTYYAQAAAKILADAPSSGIIMIRAGHEFNIQSYPWGVLTPADEANYAATFQVFATAFRSVSNRFRFIWNPNWISTGSLTSTYDVMRCYPGDASVDAFGTDLYYNGTKDDPSPDVAFNYARDLSGYGLQAMVTLAAAHGKPCAMCEFGLSWDKPAWVDLMYKWMRDNKFAYAGYFDANPDYPWQLSDNSKPDSGVRFKADFRDKAVEIPADNWTFTYGNEGFSPIGAATFAVVAGEGRVSGGANFSDRAQKNFTLLAGRRYRMEMDLDTGGKNARVSVSENTTPFNTLGVTTISTASKQRVSFTFDATQTNLSFRVIPYAADAAQVVKFDNILRYLVE
jgi:hypothetical protein